MTATETDPVAEVAPVVRRRRGEAPSTGGRRGRQGRRSGRAGGDGSRTVWWQLASTAAFAVLIVALALLGFVTVEGRIVSRDPGQLVTVGLAALAFALAPLGALWPRLGRWRPDV